MPPPSRALFTARLLSSPCFCSSSLTCRFTPPPPTCLARRPFHSHDHPPAPGPFTPIEKTLLAASYAHVPTNGFTTKALALGARDAGLLDISPAVLPDGPFSLVRWHLVTQREALAMRSKQLFEADDATPAPMGVGQKVSLLMWERLLANKDIINHWQEALALMAQPTYVGTSLKELATLSDEIWFLAGDPAVDFSWYTKRTTLSIVYSTSELFMTNDRTTDFADTRAFLQRRLDEVKTVGAATGAVGQWLGYTASAGLNVLRSKGFRI